MNLVFVGTSFLRYLFGTNTIHFSTRKSTRNWDMMQGWYLSNDKRIKFLSLDRISKNLCSYLGTINLKSALFFRMCVT